ncbi:MAG: hypothetical protein IPM32_00335 [Ignavibacteriae bacterium]|nr:hypothetical protein [Ignavibacteriota bacterium]
MNQVYSYFKNKFVEIIFSNDGTIKVYSSYQKENDAIKYGVGIYNRSESAVLKLTGNDVLDFLQRISTNDVKNLEPYHYISTLFTNEKGRLIDRTALIRLHDEYFLVGSKFNESLLSRWIEKYIITENVKLENFTSKFLILDIIGPQAESYLTLICGKEVDELDNNKLHKVEINFSTAYLLKKKAQSGEIIYWLITEIENSEKLLDYLLNHKSVFDLEMVGEDAFDRYRVINKVPRGGNEITDKFNPHETNLKNEISFTKGCYIGQEVIARLDTYDKVQKHLRKFTINTNNINVPAELLNDNKEVVCTITTLTKNLEQNKFEGLGYFSKSLIEKNGEIELSLSEKSETKFTVRILN